MRSEIVLSLKQSIEELLVLNLRDFAADLRLNDIEQLIAHLLSEKDGNISALVASSSELFFLPGTIRYGRSGNVLVSWGLAPVIELDLEFHHQSVDAYFKLRLEADQGGVEINAIDVDQGAACGEHVLHRLRQALEQARLFAPPASHQRIPPTGD